MTTDELADEATYDQYHRPCEIWALQYLGSNGQRFGFVPPQDEDGTANFIAWPSHRQAEIGLTKLMEEGELEDGDVEIVQLH